MSALKSTPTLRWERREKDEKEMLASEESVYRQLLGKLLWIDRAELRCAMGKASSSLGRASDADVRNIQSILRYFRGNAGIMTVGSTTLDLELAKRVPEGSVLTYGDSVLAADADRFTVSGTASRRSHSAVVKLSWFLHSVELLKAWTCNNSGLGY